MNYLYIVIVMLLFIGTPINYYAYKSKAGYKNETAAKLIFYQQMIAAVAVSFFILQPLHTISAIGQYIVSMVLLVICVVTNYFLTKKIEQSAQDIKK